MQATRRAMGALGGALALCALLGGRAVLAGESPTRIEGVSFEPSTQLGGQPLVLNGIGVRAVAWLKGYAAGLYLPQRVATMEQVYALPGAKRLQMRMLVEVPVGEFVKAFHKGIGRNTPEAQQPGLVDRMSQFDGQIQPLGKVRKGDTVNLDFTPGQGLLVSVNGRALGPAIAGDDFYDALLGIFIGPKPVDDRLKAGLLGTAA